MTKCFECDGYFDFPAYIVNEAAKRVLGMTLYTPVCPWCGAVLYKKEEKTKETPKT